MASSAFRLFGRANAAAFVETFGEMTICQLEGILGHGAVPTATDILAYDASAGKKSTTLKDVLHRQHVEQFGKYLIEIGKAVTAKEI